jgi:hypothetical protein
VQGGVSVPWVWPVTKEEFKLMHLVAYALDQDLVGLKRVGHRAHDLAIQSVGFQRVLSQQAQDYINKTHGFVAFTKMLGSDSYVLSDREKPVDDTRRSAV